MTITRYGKCATCRQPTAESKTFVVTIDMFNPAPKTYLQGDLLKQVREWRKQKLYCGGHKYES